MTSPVTEAGAAGFSAARAGKAAREAAVTVRARRERSFMRVPPVGWIGGRIIALYGARRAEKVTDPNWRDGNPNCKYPHPNQKYGYPNQKYPYPNQNYGQSKPEVPLSKPEVRLSKPEVRAI